MITNKTMLKKLPFFLLLPVALFLPSAANALPGDTVDQVKAWIAGNPTLRPGIGDGLVVRKSDTAAQQFTFQATVLSPGRVEFTGDRTIIRTETFSFFDVINGVTANRLAESLRTLYGADIYQDFANAQVIYDYPSPQTVELARRQNRPLLAAQQGQLRQGARYAYWVEVVQTNTGKAFNGKMTIFLKEDLNKLETELRDR